MKRCILVLLLFCTPLLVIHALPRKKVAIVLSGGGAKGVAHIGALKVIEELGIPIDYVAGTSIGAIVGGLYSIGYTSEQLEIIVKQTNWIDLLTDKISRDAIPFPFKLDDSKYLISLPIKNNEIIDLIKEFQIKQKKYLDEYGLKNTSGYIFLNLHNTFKSSVHSN